MRSEKVWMCSRVFCRPLRGLWIKKSEGREAAVDPGFRFARRLAALHPRLLTTAPFRGLKATGT